MKFPLEIFFFGLAGLFGFMVDAAVLYLLRGTLGPFYARIVSFMAAVFATWLANRNLTFRERRSGLSKKQEFAVYLILMLAGGAINYGVYAWLIISFQFILRQPIIGVAAGSLSGMAVNFAGSRFLFYQFVLRREPQEDRQRVKSSGYPLDVERVASRPSDNDDRQSRICIP